MLRPKLRDLILRGNLKFNNLLFALKWVGWASKPGRTRATPQPTTPFGTTRRSKPSTTTCDPPPPPA